ncbi:hypothetical protein [Rhodococcus opacus]|uniref:Uncharacterized protein n=1 Tax=Rhodococcus opacus TaxID=37919 RepID=A0A076EXE7_RHOOP|nr:hypothetical protein [Rhodococcus opacus]AII10476.1 hypothetical protein EP51_40060 [Rhodococcus opacus]
MPQWRRSPHGADDTEWVAVVELTEQSPDGTRDLDVRTRGTVHWIQPDTYADPANADNMARISVPMPRPRLSDETAGLWPCFPRSFWDR